MKSLRKADRPAPNPPAPNKHVVNGTSTRSTNDLIVTPREPKPPLLIVVHGVGSQAHLQSLKSFVEGITANFEIPSSATRAQLAHQLHTAGEVAVPGVPFTFSEFNYAKTIEPHLPYAESEPRAWVRSLRHRLKEINRARGGPAHIPFAPVENAADDLLFATTLARFIAVRLHIETAGLSHAAVGFLQQVQLYVDYPDYRDEIDTAFKTFIEAAVATGGEREITIAAHSLGTVVAFRALLNAAARGEPWVKSVRHLVTFGSPVELLWVLFPEFFPAVPAFGGTPIQWSNYSMGNDPIASDLALTRRWVTEECPGLFAPDAPEEIDLGPGSLTGAHTEYWGSQRMLQEICAMHRASSSADAAQETTTPAPASANRTAASQPAAPLAQRARSATTIFHATAVMTAAVVAWLILVWWEDNLGPKDASTSVLISSSWQLVFWVMLWAMILLHARCWSASLVKRSLAWLGCAAFTGLLAWWLPGLSVLDGFVSALKLSPKLHPFSPDHQWNYGNLVLALVPLSALPQLVGGRQRSRGGKGTVIALLAALTFGLSLLVGTHNTPSAVAGEFGVLSLAFALWWLALLLARIDEAFRSFIGGRRHFETLRKLWNIRDQPRAFRRAAQQKKSD